MSIQWGVLLLTLTGFFSAGISLYLHRQTGRLKFLGLFLASFFFILVTIALILAPVLTGNISSFILGQIVEWGHVYCMALILSTLLLFVRESKPEFSQFPIIYVAFPIVIVLSYLLVYNTVILKKWLINIYHAAAIVVSVLMYGFYSYHEAIYKRTFAGSVMFLVTFLLYLLLPETFSLIWQIALSISIVTLFSGYLLVEQYFDNLIETE